MKINYDRGGGRVEISECELTVSDEAFTSDQLHWLQHQMWMLANTTLSERLSNTASQMESILAALTNDTDAVILHMKKDPA